MYPLLGIHTHEITPPPRPGNYEFQFLKKMNLNKTVIIRIVDADTNSVIREEHRTVYSGGSRNIKTVGGAVLAR